MPEPNSFYPLHVRLRWAVDIQRAREELEQTETPWEPYRELAHPIANASAADGWLWAFVSWHLVPALIKTIYRAKDTCAPSEAGPLAQLAWRVEIALERRPAIERLGDVVR
jgi:hypothetical protein